MAEEAETSGPVERHPGDDACAPQHSHVSRWLTTLLRPIHSLLVALYLRVEVVHPERIPRVGPVLLVPTHRSRWDAVVLYCATRRLLRYMASHDEFIGAQGWLMRHLGTFPINTKRPSAGSLRECRRLILEGEILVIFPEGTIYYYPPHNVHPIKPGTAWLALGCQAQIPDSPFPIVPVRIVYGDRHPRFRTRVQLIVQEPIAIGPYLEMPHKAAIRQLTADLQRSLGDVVNESLLEMSPPRPETR